MRVSIYLASLVFLATATQALAGSITYVDMRGKWESTKCKAPTPWTEQARDPEIAASDLNAQYEAKNAYVAQAQDYMLCLSKEASTDAEATSILATKTAQSLIDKTKAEVDAAIGASATNPASK